MTLTLGFSPCPNDCFIFDALLHEKIDTEGLKFKPVIEDVETLNKKAFKNYLDVTKLSFFAYSQVQKNYSLLNSGAAMGFGVGPLVIAKPEFPFSKLQDNSLQIAIPGKNTTANLLFSIAYPHLQNKKEMIFSEIEKVVLQGKFDLGVIIHESRFTYEEKGLKKIIDLGEWWEKKNNCPLPLGGIFIKNSFPQAICKKVERIIRKSVIYAFKNPESSKAFVKQHAQELNDLIIQQHIHLYVNKFSISLGEKGQNAVRCFIRESNQFLLKQF
jgi:1,4-dihydroxy-6-naphthoate synthase